MDNQQQTPSAGMPIYQESQQKNAKWLWLLIALIIVGALVFAFVRGIGPLGQLRQKVTSEETPAAQSVVSPTPESSSEATAEADLDRSEPAIRVLNGSGVSGVASSFKNFLEEKGYSVASIGNADNYDFTQTVIRFKEGFKKFERLLVSDLSDDYSVSVSNDDLEATDSADIEIIVGSK